MLLLLTKDIDNVSCANCTAPCCNVYAATLTVNKNNKLLIYLTAIGRVDRKRSFFLHKGKSFGMHLTIMKDIMLISKIVYFLEKLVFLFMNKKCWIHIILIIKFPLYFLLSKICALTAFFEIIWYEEEKTRNFDKW